MAKSWKSFVSKESVSEQEAGSELSGIGNELTLSLEELARSNAELRAMLEERNALEEKMSQLINPSAGSELQNPRFGGEIGSITEKRKGDQKRFEARQKLQEKIKLKNAELAEWAKKTDRLKEKVNKVKSQFEQKKKEISDLKRKVKEKTSDGFDYDKIRNPIKKIADEFPFVERIAKPKEDLAKNPIEKVKEIIRDKPAVKKIVDDWEILRDKKREAEKIKSKFDQVIQKKNDLFAFKDRLEKNPDDIKPDDIESLLNAEKEEEKQNEKKAEKKDQEKTSLFDRLLNKRGENKSGERKKKQKSFSTDDLDNNTTDETSGSDNSETAAQRKKDEEKEFAEKEQLKQQRIEERRAQRREAQTEEDFDGRARKPKKTEDETSGNDTREIALKKKQEDDEADALAKREQLKQNKLEEKRAETRREQRQEERKRKKTDKFN